MARPSRPTGITTDATSNAVVISWVKNPENDIQGYNIYNSTTSGGGVSDYTKLNNDLITIPTNVEDRATSSTTTVEIIGGQRVTTTTETITQITIFSYTHNNLLDGKRQYYVITAVNNTNEESLYSIEINELPLNITTNLIEYPIRSPFDVAKSAIDVILPRDAKIDVKPGTMTRDIHIDPQASEFGHLYVYIDFLFRSESLLTLLEIDDPNNTGESIPVAESTYKQQLKAALQLKNDSDVQDIIDTAFEKLTGNYKIYRKGATSSIGSIIFYTVSKPTSDITVPAKTIVSTNPTSAVSAINFSTNVDAQMLLADIDSYFNDATQRYEITVPITSIETGIVTNVASGTIVNSTFSILRAINIQPTSYGRDEESNLDLASRGMLAFTSLDVGMLDGYLRTAIEVQGVEDVLVVDAGHVLMQRDYDEVRHKHVFGKVDIYFKGESQVTYTDTIGFLYKSVLDETATVLDATNFRIQLSNPQVTSAKPIYLVQQITNISLARSYDLTGNYTLFKNLIEIPKNDYTVDLVTGAIEFYTPLNLGNQITANYEYKSLVPDEILILSAIGGEIVFTFANNPVAIYSETVTLTRGTTQTIFIRGTDYTINYNTGTVTLSSGLQLGDSLVTTYKKVVTITGEVVVLAATEGQITANFVNSEVVESMIIEENSNTKIIHISQYNTINQSIGLSITDLINVTYKYRDTSPIVLTNQPVDTIVSISTSNGGTLTEQTQYIFNKVDNLLLDGNSTHATRSIQLIYDPILNLPNGNLLRQVDTINLVGLEQKQLSKKGADSFTIVVTDLTKTITYIENVDYTIISPTTPIDYTYILRTNTSSILDGQDILITYQYGELVTVSYNVNSLIISIQNSVDKKRHLTADVLVKQANIIHVDLEFTIKLRPNTNIPVVKNELATALYTELDSKKIGDRVNQSDIIRIIDQNTSVDYVVLPLTRMTIADGTHIANEQLINPLWTVYQSGAATCYKTNVNQLKYKTLGSNSDSSKFWRVSQDDRELTLVASENLVATGAGRAFIKSDGAVYVSTIDSDDPASHKFTVAYNVFGELGSKDIVISDLDYLSLHALIIHTS